MKDLEVTLYLDGNPDRHADAHREHEVQTLKSRVRELEYNNAELVRSNEELSERVKKLATRTPAWPKGYRPRGRFNGNRKSNERRN